MRTSETVQNPGNQKHDHKSYTLCYLVTSNVIYYFNQVSNIVYDDDGDKNINKNFKLLCILCI